MKATFPLFLILLAFYSGGAQKVSTKSFRISPLAECTETESKKAQKFLDEGMNRKNSKEERIEALRKAVEEDPDLSQAHYLLGLESLRTALSKGVSLKPAQNYLKECIRLCPEFHFEPYYFLAEISLGRAEYAESVKYFEKYYELSASSVDPLDDSREDEIKLDYEYAKFFDDAYKNPKPFNAARVSQVCTEDDEFLPLISPDNESMLLTRRYTVKSEVKASLLSEKELFSEKFVKAKLVNGKFEEGDPFPSPFNENESWHYGGATVSLDNKHLYLTICKPSSMGYTNCDIYQADLHFGIEPKSRIEGYYWSNLRSLGDKINTPNGFESQPSISADGQTLYFTSDRGDNAGLEIYYSTKNDNGNWTEAKNIGPPINTPYNDKTPFIHSDSRTLYFASDGHLGFGGLDVFYTKQNDDGTWQKPVNLGHPINTGEDEQAFVVSTDGKRVYYSAKDKDRPQSIEIWTFELYKEARPDKVVFVKGQLTDDVGNPVEGGRVELKTMQSKQITTVDVSNEDGKYAAVVAVRDNEDVVMNIKADGKAFQSKLIEVEEEGDMQPRASDEELVLETFQDIDVEVEELEEGGVYKINDIYYSSNSAEITKNSKAILDEFALYLLENGSMRIAIHGHTDNVGKAEKNLVLSADRAFSVKQYLEVQGVEGSRIEYKGFGETVPFASNETEEGRALNRRTEFLILSVE